VNHPVTGSDNNGVGCIPTRRADCAGSRRRDTRGGRTCGLQIRSGLQLDDAGAGAVYLKPAARDREVPARGVFGDAVARQEERRVGRTGVGVLADVDIARKHNLEKLACGGLGIGGW